MTLTYDLHSHSRASDGSLTPTELVTRAKLQGVDVLALTDHDVVDGLVDAGQTAISLGLKLIPGVEISVTWNNVTIHVLGLGIDRENECLLQGLSELRRCRDQRAEIIAKRLADSGIDGALEGAKNFASGAIISRTHFAHFLVRAGYAKNVRDVFKRFLVKNKPGYVAGKWASLEQAVEWITGAGGQAVIAHPARYKLSATKLRCLLEAFRLSGGIGLEVVSSSHNESECALMGRYATQFELLASCGSDYHGPEQTWAELGRMPAMPEECIPIWCQWN
ncbi:MAG: PHP domain-containing protein [Gammaproteobacteria bacterium]|nr:PHP domain-containing protein [Gammaproteobacteria bacterium]